MTVAKDCTLNGAGYTLVSVTLGPLAGGEDQARVGFTVRNADPLPPGVTEVQNHGLASGDSFPDLPTDDPSTVVPDDPMVDVIAVVAGPLPMPVLSPLGGLLLALLPTAAGLAARRRGCRLDGRRRALHRM